MYTNIASKISLSICLIAAVILLIMISTVLVNTEGSYTSFIQSQALTQNNIQFAIVIASLILIFFTALISWLISLYSSFRIAGPLYRITQNLASINNADKMINIRSDDQLHELSKKIFLTVEQLDVHKQLLLTTIESLQKSLKQPNTEQNRQQLTDLLQQLKQLDSKTKFDV